jgi:hypothetical protein
MRKTDRVGPHLGARLENRNEHRATTPVAVLAWCVTGGSRVNYPSNEF